ncbi:Receptor expression-enhancing protein 4 [Plecturocebus cupreus]
MPQPRGVRANAPSQVGFLPAGAALPRVSLFSTSPELQSRRPWAAGSASAEGQLDRLSASRNCPDPPRPSPCLNAPKAGKMVSWMICRLVVLVFGMLYPAYASYKAVKTKNIREYVRWMMYWIVFALFMLAEIITDIFISWFPFYYEIKMAFVLWLLSPYTKGASLLYRKFVHPSLSRHEKEIDAYLVQAKERSYETMLSFGKRGLNIAASAAVQAATKVLRAPSPPAAPIPPLGPFGPIQLLCPGAQRLQRGSRDEKVRKCWLKCGAEVRPSFLALAPSVSSSACSLALVSCWCHAGTGPEFAEQFSSQGALAGRLRSFSMQDLRSIPDAPAPAYQDALYPEDQVLHRRPPIGYRDGGLQDSDTEDECWSDTQAVPRMPARPREKPLSRSQSLRVIKRKPPVREVSAGGRRRGRGLCWCSPHPHAGLPLFPGHLALPKGSDEEKDCALRHGQLGSAASGPFLPRALQGSGVILRDLWLCIWPACTSCWAPASLLLLMVKGREQMLPRPQAGCTVMYQSRLGQHSIYCLPLPPPSLVVGPEPSQNPCK